ncbi:MAG: hypothetical protein ACRD0K_21935 [Egibacteraceae bacterium]
MTRATDRMIQYWDSPEMIADHEQQLIGVEAERRAAAWRAASCRRLRRGYSIWAVEPAGSAC